ncbi:MAG: VC0807 family protein [Acidimicrobiia bacterium]
MARRAVPHLVEGTLLPLGLFYLTMWLLGIWGAIAVSLTWSWGIIALRLLTRRRVPGLVLVGALGLTARSLVSYLAASEFIYFLQPTLATVLLAAAFLVSAPAGRPLAARLAHDFLPMPGWFASQPVIRRFFIRITVLWGGIQLANAGLSLWLLISQPVSIYLVTKTVATAVIMGLAVCGSTVWFRRLVDRHGLSSLPAAGDSL